MRQWTATIARSIEHCGSSHPPWRFDAAERWPRTWRCSDDHSQPAENRAAPVRDFDADDDTSWFAARRHRLFRARRGDGGTWLIRRRKGGSEPDVLLRTFSRGLVAHDTEGQIAQAWFATAYPAWPPDRVAKAVRKALKRGRG
jgi:hypothetical protein